MNPNTKSIRKPIVSKLVACNLAALVIDVNKYKGNYHMLVGYDNFIKYNAEFVRQPDDKRMRHEGRSRFNEIVPVYRSTQ